LIKDLVQFFEERDLHEVAIGLKEDMKSIRKKNQDDLLVCVRKALDTQDRRQKNMISKGTSERQDNKARPLELLPK
jgi:hypothetical protein